MRRSPWGASAASSGISRPALSNSSSGVAAQPVLEHLEVPGERRRLIGSGIWCDAEGAFSFCTPSTSFGPVQPLGVRSTIIGQRGRVFECCCAGGVLDLVDLLDGPVGRGGHALVHCHGVVAFDEDRRPAAAEEELLEFLVADASQDRGVAIL
jgi:hypothetical protein